MSESAVYSIGYNSQLITSQANNLGCFILGGYVLDVIRKTDTIRDVKDILDYHGMSLGHGWELIIAMLLSDCEYAEVHGFGSNAYFNKIFKEDINETA